MTQKYNFQATETGDYALTLGDLVIEASRVRWAGAELHGELTANLAGTAELPPTAVQFTKPASRQELKALLEGRAEPRLLDELCRCVVEAERANRTPAVRLCDVPRPTLDREFTTASLPAVPRTSMAIWFGDGGTGKSLIALQKGGLLAQQGVPVLFLDWEWDASEHRLRYEKLFGAEMPRDLHYWTCERPLAQCADEIRRYVKKHAIGYVIVDSIAYACGGNPESSEVAAEYKRYAQSLGVGSLHLAHVPKNGNREKPFGSTFWHNSARSTWYVHRLATHKPRRNAHGQIAYQETVLQWFHCKSNTGPLETEERTMRLIVDNQKGTIALKPEGLPGSPRRTVADRIATVLGNGALTADELCARLPAVKADSLKRTVRRDKRFERNGDRYSLAPPRAA